MERGYLPKNETESSFRFSCLLCTPHPRPTLGLKGCRSREGEGKRADMIMVRVLGCQRFTLLACSLAKKIQIWLQHEKYRMSAISSHDIGDSIYFFYYYAKAKWLFKLPPFTNKCVSATPASDKDTFGCP